MQTLSIYGGEKAVIRFGFGTYSTKTPEMLDLLTRLDWSSATSFFIVTSLHPYTCQTDRWMLVLRVLW